MCRAAQSIKKLRRSDYVYRAMPRCLKERLGCSRLGRQVNNLGWSEHSKHSIPIGGMGDIGGEQLCARRQVDRRLVPVHLRMKYVHDSDVITCFHETVTECRADETCSPGDEHGCCQADASGSLTYLGKTK
jgi:hypothetical protein